MVMATVNHVHAKPALSLHVPRPPMAVPKAQSKGSVIRNRLKTVAGTRHGLVVALCYATIHNRYEEEEHTTRICSDNVSLLIRGQTPQHSARNMWSVMEKYN